MLPTFFLINPASGNGNVKVTLPLIRREFSRQGIPFDLHVTTRPGEATEVARAVSGSFRALVAVGGDGTINEVLNGMGAENVLGVLATGSGNDFSRALALPKSLEKMVQVLAAQRTRHIDRGYITTIDLRSARRTRSFLNAVGIGLDASVAHRAQRIPWLRGLARYMVAALRSVVTYDPPSTRLIVDDREYVGEHLLIAVGNGKSAGGGFYLTPDALLDDGLFDVCWATRVSVPERLMILPFVLRGRHARFRKVHFAKIQTLLVQSDQGLPVHVDGEVIGIDEKEIRVEVRPKSVEIIVP